MPNGIFCCLCDYKTADWEKIEDDFERIPVDSIDDGVPLTVVAVGFSIVVPLFNEEDRFAEYGKALVEFIADHAGRHFHDGETAWLRTMANQAAAALENASLVQQLRDAAETDPVTGVYSHRHLQDRIRQETSRAVRSGSPLSVLMVDLDDFKRVNDEYGHQAGDRVLRAIAGALKAAVRDSDVVARYGGDEFVVLMPDTAAAEAARVAQRASTAVAALAHPMADGSDVHVSCSVGLALHPRDGGTARELLRSADANMYTQKRARGESLPVRDRRAAGGAPATSVPISPGTGVTV